MLRIIRAWFRQFEARSATRQRHPGRWGIEELEARLLLTTYTPAQISLAYGVNQIQFGSVKGDGTGQTIAIVDAYDAPNINKDLMTFDAMYGLSNNDGKGAFVLTKATPQGKPAYNAGWAQEITLDVEWAHAIAPGAHILLVEAASNSYSDLMAAVNYARTQVGVSVVSMSWGGSEFAGETAYDSYFTTPAGHQGVTFVASAGDTGALPEYPAVSPNVLSVGGTTLKTATNAGTYGSETTWTASGGGISVYEAKPSFQSTVTQSATKRTTPDVSYDANPSTGVAVYFTGSNGRGSWYTFGGTSIGAPQWAALIAIADQGRALNGLGTLDGRTQLLPAIYKLPVSDFHDVTQGTAGSGRFSLLSATAGYDLVTGRGTPYANLLVRDLVSTTYAGGTVVNSNATTASTTVTAHAHLIEIMQPVAIPVVRLNQGGAIGPISNGSGLQFVQSQMGLDVRFQPHDDTASVGPGAKSTRSVFGRTTIVSSNGPTKSTTGGNADRTVAFTFAVSQVPAKSAGPLAAAQSGAGARLPAVDASGRLPVSNSILTALVDYHLRLLTGSDSQQAGSAAAKNGMGGTPRTGTASIASAAFFPWISPSDADNYFARLSRAKRTRRRRRSRRSNRAQN